MAYSSKKPYQTPSKDYVQFLKQHVGPESVFEKPYLQKEYGEMNQSPNVPTVPPAVGGEGELVCLYDSSSCEITVGCYAGPGIRIIGGPEEAAAGYGDLKIIQGAVISWAVQQDARAIEIVLDPTVSRNVVEVLFVDGWGRFYTQTVDITCEIPPAVYDVYQSANNTDDAWVVNRLRKAPTPPPAYDLDEFYPGERIMLGAFWNSVAGEQWKNETFCRFRVGSPNIAQGTTILGAYVTFYGDPVWSPWSGATFEIKIEAEDADSPSAPTSYAEFEAITPTSASVVWTVDPTDLVSNSPMNTPELKTIIQEIVNRGGWGADQYIILKFTLNYSPSYPSTKYVNFYDYDDGGVTYGPKLNILV